MMKIVCVMMVGLMGMGVHAEEGGVILDTSDFGLLCNVTRAATGVWNSVIDLYDQIDPENIDMMHKTINEIFFGSQLGEGGSSFPYLPLNFEKYKPKRREVCGSNSVPNGFPPTSDSLASTIFCLCMGTFKTGKALCELTIEGSGVWLDDGEKPVVVDFHAVWGDHQTGGVMYKCGNTSEYNKLEDAKKDLTQKREILETTLKNKTRGLIDDKHPTCEGKSPCAIITPNPTWPGKFKSLEEISKTILSLVQEKKEALEKEAKKTEADRARQDTSTSVPKEAPQPIAPPTPEPEKSPEPVKTPKQETRKAPEETLIPQPMNKPEDTPQKQEEDIHPQSEDETSGFLLTSPKWPLLAASLLC
ncbi:Variant surface glycoprotein [Trypanosoma congolense IL3000]|uniref:Variant surface glycoprotein n=1 Tax=Trypanosoma congolense (strain IL3000) TaxID=1068625 RepID=F9WHB4_TRYCI|nr:Variant surface glycoprotein [Trypanosoma congolense IL3000]